MTKKTRVLFVDDDANLLNAARRLLRKEIDMQVATGGEEALKLLEQSDPFDVLVSDQNMPSMKGVALLSEAAKRWPLTVRVMLTGNDDQATTISAVNEGKVFRFVRKPCQPADLLEAINEAARHHALLAGEKSLLEQTLSGSVKVLTDVLALTKPAVFRKASLVQKWAHRIGPRLGLASQWEVNLAAMLYPLGIVALPESVADKYLSGGSLSPEEDQMVKACPRTARDLIQNIPRLESIAKAIYYSRKGYDGSGFPNDEVSGEDIPVIARLLRILTDLVEHVADRDASIPDGLAHLAETPHLYDFKLLEIIKQTLATSEEASSNRTQIFNELPPTGLLEGDIIMKPIKDTNDRVLLTSGVELTPVTIKRLKHMHDAGMIPAMIHISRWQNTA